MLIYDGDCGICTRSAAWAADRLPTTEVVPSHSVDLVALGLTIDDVTTAAYWRHPDGTLARGHRAVAATLASIGGPWWIVGRAIDAPGVSILSRALYRLVADNRYRLPGSTCALPTLASQSGPRPLRRLRARRGSTPG